MEAIITSTIVKLVAVAAVAATIGALAGAGVANRGARRSSRSMSQTHKPFSVCGIRPTPRPQFVNVELRSAAIRHGCRPTFALV